IYENLDTVAKARRGKLEENRELAFRSRELIFPQPTEAVPFDELTVREPDLEELLKLCRRIGLKKLTERFSGDAGQAAAGSAMGVLDREIEASDVSLDELLIRG
ncbi:DNA polymerase I, partial [Cloacibacillus evryensis]|nr:DNA polymerase I [Cloacibacillus evryensis]